MIKNVKNAVGLNATVARIQIAMDAAFDKLWSDKDEFGADTKDGIICFPICFINFKRLNQNIDYNKRIIEHFDYYSDEDIATQPIGGGNDYVDILDSDTNKMIILNDYDIEPVESVNFEATRLDIIFIVDLTKTHPGTNQRQAAIEELRIEVVKILEKIPNITVLRSVRRLNKVFGDIEYSILLDLHPSHCFKVVVSVDRFSKNDKICINN